jgi:hypothetical protein
MGDRVPCDHITQKARHEHDLAVARLEMCHLMSEDPLELIRVEIGE